MRVRALIILEFVMKQVKLQYNELLILLAGYPSTESLPRHLLQPLRWVSM